MTAATQAGCLELAGKFDERRTLGESGTVHARMGGKAAQGLAERALPLFPDNPAREMRRIIRDAEVSEDGSGGLYTTAEAGGGSQTNIYDTAHDPDGGAWRYRALGKSWALEAAGANRSARAIFPRLTSITAHTSGVLILDMDTVGTPEVWMRFTFGTGSLLPEGYVSGLVSAHMCNGVMFVGHGGGRLYVVDFLRDAIGCVDKTGAFVMHGRIVDRNGGLSLGTCRGNAWFRHDALFSPAKQGVASCIAFVPPDAWLDPVTRTYKTLAAWIGTNNSGDPSTNIQCVNPVGVIAGAEIVNTYASRGRMDMDCDGNVFVPRWTSNNYYSYMSTPGRLFGGASPHHSYVVGATYKNFPSNLVNVRLAGTRKVVANMLTPGDTDVGLLVGQYSRGPGMLAQTSGTGFVAGLIFNDFTGGMVPGFCRHAMESGKSGALTEQVAHTQDFSTGAPSGWIFSANTVVSAGELLFTATGANYPNATLNLTNLVAGRSYTLEFDVTALSAGALYARWATGNLGAAPAETSLSGATDFGWFQDNLASGFPHRARLQFTAKSTTECCTFTFGPTAGTAKIDNVRVHSAVLDCMSHYGYGLGSWPLNQKIHGTGLTWGNPLGSFEATGVTGFSGTSYLRTNHIGTEVSPTTYDWTIGTWFYLPYNAASTTQRTLLHFGDSADEYVRIYQDSADEFLKVVVRDGGVSTVISTNIDPRADGWIHVAASRTQSGKVLVYVDGITVVSATLSPNLSFTAPIFILGNAPDLASPFGSGGYLALAKVNFYTGQHKGVRGDLLEFMVEHERPILHGSPFKFTGTTPNITATGHNFSHYDPDTGLWGFTTNGQGIHRTRFLQRVDQDTDYTTVNYGHTDGRRGAIMHTNYTGTTLKAKTPGVDKDFLQPQNTVAYGPLTARNKHCTVTYSATVESVHRVVIRPGEMVLIAVSFVACSRDAPSTCSAAGQRHYYASSAYDGAITLHQSVNPQGSDHETNAALDVSASVGATSHSITLQVTGLASTTIMWELDVDVLRLDENSRHFVNA